MSEQLSIDQIRIELLDFAKSIGATFVESGEIGFGRPCVGFTNGRSYLCYSPMIIEPMALLRELWDEEAHPPDGVDHVCHKYDYMAILITDEFDQEAALRELHIWAKHIASKGGGKIISYSTGHIRLQAMISGSTESCIVTLPFFEALKTRIDELHPAIDRNQFMDEKAEVEVDPDDSHKIWRCKIHRFKSDTGKFYDEIEMGFDSPSTNDAFDIIRIRQADRKFNQSGFIFVVTGEGNLENLHPKLFKHDSESDMRKALMAMEFHYAEKRSDVSDIIGDILAGKSFDESKIEHRFSSFKLPDGTKVEYDTLTTLLHIIDPETDQIMGDAISGEYHD